jgi:hypothetical protein
LAGMCLVGLQPANNKIKIKKIAKRFIQFISLM